MSMRGRIGAMLSRYTIADEEEQALISDILDIVDTAFEKPVCSKEEYDKLNEELLGEALKASRAQTALQMLGLPDTSDKRFDAEVTYAAYRLGRLKPVEG